LGFHISQPSTFLSFLFNIGSGKLGLTSKDVEEEPSPSAEAQERLEFIKWSHCKPKRAESFATKTCRVTFCLNWKQNSRSNTLKVEETWKWSCINQTKFPIAQKTHQNVSWIDVSKLRSSAQYWIVVLKEEEKAWTRLLKSFRVRPHLCPVTIRSARASCAQVAPHILFKIVKESKEEDEEEVGSFRFFFFATNPSV
jgi:hypothetical protein